VTIDNVASIISNAVQVIIIGSMPSVGLGLLIGLLVAIFQAVTQIQEQTLTFVPKMVVVFLVLAVTFPWMASLILDFAVGLWTDIPVYSR